MPMTLRELMEHMKQWDESTIVDRLSITPEELVERFADKIDEQYEELAEEMEEEEE